ncbi:MAG TPA: hypothetical protein VLA21_05555 [Candidatus Limnocylindria bacterium]|nr:hypothetical protein [Candidatus Limnocylindria bacterium]
MSQTDHPSAEALRQRAAELFNATWDLLERRGRTEEEDLDMVHMAHASRHFWGLAGGDRERATGEWQVSRVYARLHMGQSALFHARASLRYCEKAHLPAFDRAFAYEAIARAHALLDNADQLQIFLAKARQTAPLIEKEEDRKYLLAELDTIL